MSDKTIVRKLNSLVPVIIFAMFTVMILACVSSKNGMGEGLRNAPSQVSGDDTHALVTDSATTHSFDDLAMITE